MRKTVIYVFGPRRLANCYVQDDPMDLSVGGWLKIGETHSSNIELDNREVALKRINEIVHTGIPEPCQLLDVFEYPYLYDRMDSKIRNLLTDTHNLESSKQYNTSLKSENFEIKAGDEFVYGVNRKQVLNALARFERDLIVGYYTSQHCEDIIKSILVNQDSVQQNGPTISEYNLNLEEQSSCFDKLWSDVSKQIVPQVKSRVSIPKGRAYMFLKSKSHNDLFFYTLGYSVRSCTASVSIETFGGEDAKMFIEKLMAQSNVESPLKSIPVKQGAKNKNKWAWTISNNIDKTDADLLKWYVDTILSFYHFFENLHDYNEI